MCVWCMRAPKSNHTASHFCLEIVAFDWHVRRTHRVFVHGNLIIRWNSVRFGWYFTLTKRIFDLQFGQGSFDFHGMWFIFVRVSQTFVTCAVNILNNATTIIHQSNSANHPVVEIGNRKRKRNKEHATTRTQKRSTKANSQPTRLGK